MKVLLVNHFPLLGSGSGVYTDTVAKYLTKLGHDVCIIMPAITKDFEKIDGIRYCPVYFTKEEVIEGQLPFNFPCFTTHPESVYTFSMLSDIELQQYVSKFNEVIAREISIFQPDILHGQHIWILSALLSRYDIPLVVTAHGTDLIGYKESKRYHNYVNEVLSKVDKIITISKKNEDLVCELFPNMKGRIITIPNGYDTRVFYPSCCDRKAILEKYGIHQTYSKVVLFVGKLTSIKGVDLLLQAACSFQNDDVLFVIAGDGEERQQLLFMKDELGLHNVVFIGNRTQAELQKLYNISDVSVVPSREEAFGFVAVEALACGTPVIGTDQGEMPKFLSSDTGILISTDCLEELIWALQQVLRGKQVFSKEVISSFARENYALDHRIYQLQDVYEGVIRNHKIKVRK